MIGLMKYIVFPRNTKIPRHLISDAGVKNCVVHHYDMYVVPFITAHTQPDGIFIQIELSVLFVCTASHVTFVPDFNTAVPSDCRFA